MYRSGLWKFRSVQQGDSVVEDVSKLDMTVSFDPEVMQMLALMCNNIIGDYTIVDDVIKAPDAVSTKKYCQDNRGYAETAFATNLAAGFKVVIVGEVMTLTYGSTTIVLDRIPQQF